MESQSIGGGGGRTPRGGSTSGESSPPAPWSLAQVLPPVLAGGSWQLPRKEGPVGQQATPCPAPQGRTPRSPAYPAGWALSSCSFSPGQPLPPSCSLPASSSSPPSPLDGHRNWPTPSSAWTVATTLWLNRHCRPEGEGPYLQGSLFLLPHHFPPALGCLVGLLPPGPSACAHPLEGLPSFLMALRSFTQPGSLPRVAYFSPSDLLFPSGGVWGAQGFRKLLMGWGKQWWGAPTHPCLELFHLTRAPSLAPLQSTLDLLQHTFV